MADDERTPSISADTDGAADDGSGLGRRHALGLLGGATAAAWVAPQIISVPAASAATVAPAAPAAFVAVGAGGTVLVAPTTPDGPAGNPVDAGNPVGPGDWIDVGPVGATTLNGVASNHLGGDSTWVAVGDAGLVHVSDDSTATTWTPHLTTTEVTLTGITWASSLFLAVGAGGVIIGSPDGAIWTTLRPGNPQAPTLRAIAGNGTLVVAVGDGGTVLTSPASSLTAWTPEASGTALDLVAVAPGPDCFVAVGAAGSGPADELTITVRDPSETWTPGSSTPAGAAVPLHAVAVNPTSALALAAGGDAGGEVHLLNPDSPVYTDPWLRQGATAGVGALRAVATKAGSPFFAVGDGGQIVATANGATWLVVPSPTTADLRAIATD